MALTLCIMSWQHSSIMRSYWYALLALFLFYVRRGRCLPSSQSVLTAPVQVLQATSGELRPNCEHASQITALRSYHISSLPRDLALVIFATRRSFSRTRISLVHLRTPSTDSPQHLSPGATSPPLALEKTPFNWLLPAFKWTRLHVDLHLLDTGLKEQHPPPVDQPPQRPFSPFLWVCFYLCSLVRRCRRCLRL